MKTKLLALLLLSILVLSLLCGCEKPISSGNGNNLTPNKIGAYNIK